MKVTVWIRTGAAGEATLRTDYKYESNDSPMVQNFGRKLIKAIENGVSKAEENK